MSSAETPQGLAATQINRRGLLQGVAALAFATAVGCRPNAESAKGPEGTVGKFTLGHTNFAFQPEWFPEERARITQTIKNYFPPITKMYGSEPVTDEGNEGAFVIIGYHLKYAHEGGQAYTLKGSNYAYLEFGYNPTERVIASRLATACWGSSGLQEDATHSLLLDGFNDAVLRNIGVPGEKEWLQNAVNLKTFDPDMASKNPNIATIGESLPALSSARRIIMVETLTEALAQKPDFLAKFKANFEEYRRKNSGKTPPLEFIQTALEKAYGNNFLDFQRKNPILTKANPGKFIIIAPTVDVEGNELVTALAVERDVNGKETLMEKVPMEIHMYINGEPQPVIRHTQTDYSIPQLVTAEKAQQFARKQVDIVATSHFGKDSTTLKFL